MADQEFVSPIAAWPEHWKAVFQTELTKRINKAIAEGWKIQWVGYDQETFQVVDGDAETSTHVIHLLQETQGYVEWLMTKDN